MISTVVLPYTVDEQGRKYLMFKVEGPNLKAMARGLDRSVRKALGWHLKKAALRRLLVNGLHSKEQADFNIDEFVLAFREREEELEAAKDC